MDNLLLSQLHSGPLMVIIHSLDGGTDSVKLNLTKVTLFTYIGEACARIFTNLTTQLTIYTCPERWEIISFSPEEQKLEARQIGGEPLKVRADDPEKLHQIYGLGFDGFNYPLILN